MYEPQEYLVVIFDGPPSGDQLTKQFGKDGWEMTAILPVLHHEDDKEPQHRLQAFFCRNASKVVLAEGVVVK